MQKEHSSPLPFDACGCVIVRIYSFVIHCPEDIIVVNYSSWTGRFVKYHNIVGQVEMSTFIITICFLLYMLQTEQARNIVSVVVLMAGVFQIFAVCVFGELIAIEVGSGIVC